LARAGRSISQLAREFEPTAETIRQWIKQAALEEGLRSDGLTTSKREELNRLRRENRGLREEREILAKAAVAAQTLWKHSTEIISRDDHSYLISKQIETHKIRRLNAIVLAVPMFDIATSKLVNIQTIHPQTGKKFLRDGQVIGTYFAIGFDAPFHHRADQTESKCDLLLISFRAVRRHSDASRAGDFYCRLCHSGIRTPADSATGCVHHVAPRALQNRDGICTPQRV
jgi:transposase